MITTTTKHREKKNCMLKNASYLTMFQIALRARGRNDATIWYLSFATNSLLACAIFGIGFGKIVA